MSSERKKNRREFLTRVGAVGAASLAAGSSGAMANLPRKGKGAENLAINGGPPIRKQRLGYRAYGPQFYDDVEKQELIDVLDSKAPFRWRGSASKVLQFEK
ncbi:MAG TPA: hypothetical protein EYP14_01780, partial [Planctomycetaceae bacterium]|nr:hypothetical protein [Planctomycetaceae bacterium]